jgi:hypothetical protein
VLGRVACVALLLGGTASLLLAQRPNRQMGRNPGRPDQRAQLEGDVRREFARIVRERVGLSDAQMQKLGPLTQKFEDQRRQTQVDERNARIRLQAALLDDVPGDSAKVNALVGQLLDVQKRRLAIAEAEQKELGTIMTAHQRARFLGVQEQVRRRMEQMRPGPDDGGAPGGFGGRPSNRPDDGNSDRPGDSTSLRVAATTIR